MAEKDIFPEQIAKLSEVLELEPRGRDKKRSRVKRDQRIARRTQAVSLRLSGLTYEQVGKRMNLSTNAAHVLVTQALAQTHEEAAAELRELENARLDRAQAAIWSDVLQGDLKAVSAFLRISERRARMNGLDAPQKVDMNVNVRQEMEQALSDLETVLIQGEVVEPKDLKEATEAAPDSPHAEALAELEESLDEGESYDE